MFKHKFYEIDSMCVNSISLMLVLKKEKRPVFLFSLNKFLPFYLPQLEQYLTQGRSAANILKI